MLTATANTSWFSPPTTSSTSSYQCTTSTCVGVTAEKQAEFRKVQELANQVAKRDKLVFTALVVDGKIGPNTVALVQQLFARYKPAGVGGAINTVTAPSIAANAGAMINYLLGFLALGTPGAALPIVTNPTSIPPGGWSKDHGEWATKAVCEKLISDCARDPEHHDCRDSVPYCQSKFPPAQPGAGAQVVVPAVPAPSYAPTATGWGAWSMPQKALVVGGGVVAVAALASMLGGKKKSPAAGAVAGLRGLLGLGRSRRSRR